MEKVLLKFVSTLDSSFKKLLIQADSILEVSQLTISQFQYVNAIHELEKPTITEIARQLSVAKASVSAGINKLIARGFVTKTQSEQDKRVFYLSLTAMGEKLVNTKYKAIQEYVKFINTALSKEEAENFEATLVKLVSLFSQT